MTAPPPIPASYPSFRETRPKLVGGALCLDFVNTVEWRGVPERVERLTSYAEFLAWAEAAGAIDATLRGRLEVAARSRPSAAAATLESARALREDVAALFGPRHAPRAARIDCLNGWLTRAPQRARIGVSGRNYVWTAAGGGEFLAAPLWPIVWSAADLLVAGRAARVRSCTDRRCAWLFLDTSRSRPRRWCSMEGCGNRAKARRHYRRHRAA